MKQACFGLLLLWGLQYASAQVPFPGPCPNVKVQENFNLENYMGVWYEYEKYPFLFEIGRKCIYGTYEITGNDTISVVNSAIIRLSGKPSNITGFAKVIGSGQFALTFPQGRNSTENNTRVNYEVLGTDYTSYAVVYSCNPLLQFVHTNQLWVLTRERNPPESVIQKAEEIIDANKLKKVFLLKTVQTGCAVTGGDTDGSTEATTPLAPEASSNPADVAENV